MVLIEGWLSVSVRFPGMQFMTRALAPVFGKRVSPSEYRKTVNRSMGLSTSGSMALLADASELGLVKKKGRGELEFVKMQDFV